jgi:hypothetical protein
MSQRKMTNHFQFCINAESTETENFAKTCITQLAELQVLEENEYKNTFHIIKLLYTFAITITK